MSLCTDIRFVSLPEEFSPPGPFPEVLKVVPEGLRVGPFLTVGKIGGDSGRLKKRPSRAVRRRNLSESRLTSIAKFSFCASISSASIRF